LGRKQLESLNPQKVGLASKERAASLLAMLFHRLLRDLVAPVAMIKLITAIRKALRTLLPDTTAARQPIHLASLATRAVTVAMQSLIVVDALVSRFGGQQPPPNAGAFGRAVGLTSQDRSGAHASRKHLVTNRFTRRALLHCL
jgi:hypothetical protein